MSGSRVLHRAAILFVLLAACGKREDATHRVRALPVEGHAIPLLPRREMRPLYELALKRGAVPLPEGSFYQVEGRPNGSLHCWSPEKVRVPIDVPCAGAIHVGAELSFLAPSRRARLLWNGTLLTEATASRRPTELSLDIPADKVRLGQNDLEVEFPDAFAPHDLDPASSEIRKLGGDWDRLRVELAGPAERDASLVTPTLPFFARLQMPEAPRLHVEGRLAPENPAGRTLLLRVRDAASGEEVEHRIELPGSADAKWDVSLAEVGRGPAVVMLAWDGTEPCGGEPTLRLTDLSVTGTAKETPDLARLDSKVELFLLGIDGATFDVMDCELAAGRLPNFRSLADRGVRAGLRTLPIDHSPVIWATISTGRPPESHGIRDFTYVDEASGRTRIYTSRDRREPTVWEILSASGRSAGVIGWWNSWPAEPLRGFVVSDLFWPYPMGRQPTGLVDVPFGTTYPDDLPATLEPLVVNEAGSALDVAFLGCRSEDWYFVAEDRSSIAWAKALLARSRPAFLSLYLKNLDAYQHRYWKYMEPDDPEYAPSVRPSPEDAARYGEVIPRYYRFLDDALGELLADLGPETNVMIVSDHGFGPSSAIDTDGRELSGGHRPLGIFIAAGPAFASGLKLPERSVYDIAPTILALFDRPVAQDMPGRVIEAAFSPGQRNRTPPASVASYHALRHGRGEAEEATPREQEMLDRLHQLGYIGR